MPVVTRIEVPPPEPFVEGEDGAEAKGAGYRFVAPRTATEPLVFQAADGHALFWTPTELVYGDADGHLDYIAGSAPASFTVRGRSVHYPRTFPASEEVHVALPEGRKYWLYLYEPPRLPGAHLSGDVWFGVSGMVGGIPLPSGRHQSMESVGFRFQPVYAEDTMGARVEGWYQVVDTDAGQQLFVCIPADWLLSEDRVYPVKVDPTVATSTTTFATAYPNQRKIARFNSNGFLFAILYDGSNLVCRYSADNAQTWQTPSTGAVIHAGLSVEGSVYIDTDDYLHVVYRALGNICYRRGVPDSSRTGFAWSNEIVVGSGAAGSCPVVVAHREGSGWKAHVVWSDPPDIRTVYRPLTIDGTGGITPGSTATIGGPYGTYASTFPSIDIDQTKSLNAVWNTANSGTGRGIRFRRAPYSSGSWSWGTEEAVTQTEYANQMGPCRVDSQGRVVVSFRSSNTGNYLRVYRRNPAGGWTDISPPNQVGQHPTLAIGPSDEIYLVYTNSGLKMRVYNGSTWEDEVTLDSDPTCAYLSARQDISGSALDVVYMTGSASPYAVKSYRLPINQPPQAPSNLTRTNFDATDDAVFSWQHNDDPGDRQSAYQLEIWLDGAPIYDTGWVSSPIPNHVVPGGTLQNGKTYQWRVRTADQAGEWSPWSDYAVFQTGPKPVATILYPTAGATVSTSEVTVEWSVANQSAATVRLYDGAGQTVLQEHEVTTPSARAKTITGLENNTSYQVSVQPVSSIGVVGDEVFSGPFSVQYTPPPKPIASATEQAGFIRITITNPPPTGDEPGVTHNDLYRREPGGAWVRIATGIEPNGTFDDYAVGSGVVYKYRVRAVGANGTYTDSDVVEASITISGGIWLHDPRDPAGTVHWFQYHELPSGDYPTIPSGKFQFAGRNAPVVQFDATQKDHTLRYRLYLSDETDDRQALEALYWRRTTLCLRNHRGKKYYVTIDKLPLEFERRGAWADVEFQVVDYKEEV